MGRAGVVPRVEVLIRQVEEKLHSLEACPALRLVLWEAKEGKQSFPRHQRPSVSPRVPGYSFCHASNTFLGKEGDRGNQERET